MLGERSVFGVELYRDSEEFVSAETTTALAYLEYHATQKLGLTVSAGLTESDAWEDSVFVGVKLAARLGR